MYDGMEENHSFKEQSDKISLKVTKITVSINKHSITSVIFCYKTILILNTNELTYSLINLLNSRRIMSLFINLITDVI